MVNCEGNQARLKNSMPPKSPSQENQYHVDLSLSLLDVYSSLSPTSPLKICEASNPMDKKKKKMNI